MNFASWVILGIVVVILGFAVKATFFGKKSHGGCCDVGDAHPAGGNAAKSCDCCSTGCSGCNGCGAATAANALHPTYREINDK